MALKLKGSTSGFVAIDAPSVAGNNTLILPENTGSAHQILANDITAGVTTFTQITVSRNGDLTVPGTISIGGTLTYEDVTSVDSIGIVTARGLSIFGNTSGLSVTGVGTFAGDVSIADKIIHTGDTDTAIRFAGNDIVTIETGGSERVRVDSVGLKILDKLVHFGDIDTSIRFPAADTITAETGGSERLRIASNGDIGLGTVPETDSYQPSLYFSGGNANIWGSGNANLYTAVNVRYTTGGWRYNNNGLGSYTAQQSGTWEFRNAPSGTADNIATFTTRARIDTSGRLLIGTATTKSAGSGQYAKLNVEGYAGGTECFVSLSRAEAASAMSADDEVANLTFNDSAGYEFARIQVLADAATGATDTPGRLLFRTTADGSSSSTERMRIDKDGKVGINDTSPDADLSVSNSNTSQNAAFVDIGKAGGNRFKLGYEGNNCFLGGTSSTAMFIFKKNVNSGDNPQASGTETMRIDQDGKLKIGTTATPTQSGALNVFGTDHTTSQVSIRRGSADANGPSIVMLKNRNTDDGSHTVIQDDDELGKITFGGNDGAGPEYGARISCLVDGTPGGNDMPARLVFSTTPDGSDTLAERMHITSGGNVNIGGEFTQTSRALAVVGSVLFKRSEADLWLYSTGPNKIWRILGSTGGSTHQFRIYDESNAADRLKIGNTGRVDVPEVYGTAISSPMRDLYIESTGQLGYNPSVRASKINIADNNDVSWLYNLTPKTYNKRKRVCQETNEWTNEAESDLQYGLIAEDVELVNSNICFYDIDDSNNKTLAGVTYSQLITPLLKAIQEQKAEIDALKTRVADLEG